MESGPKSYQFDPFGTDAKKRWGRKGAPKDLPDVPGYEIIDSLGSGGMASVWSAKHIALNQPRALKVLDARLASDTEFVVRFSEEARALGRLQHPNIVRVFDASADTAPPFIAMQWVDGTTLAQVIQQRKVTLDEALGYFAQIASAMDYAHSLGFVHRDIKPSNVMITDDRQAMLIDFGVADFLGADQLGARTLTGTTRYLSPEVIAGRMATKASDIWALGVLMYRVLTGLMPFDGQSSEAILKSITNDEPAKPQNVSPKVAQFLTSTLQKDPSKRYKSATEMVQALKAIAAPWTPKVKKEGLAVGTAFILLATVAAAAVVGVGAIVYKAMQKPKVIKAPPSHSPVLGGLSQPKDETPPDEAPSTLLQDLKGVWLGDLGTKWAEARLEPTGGNKFKFEMETRDEASGPSASSVSGQIGTDGKTVSFGDASGGGGFSGSLSDDHSEIDGSISGAQVKFVRGGSVGLTSYPLQDAGLTISYPTSGWKPSETTDSSGPSVTFSPIGRADVYVRVSLTPLNGKTVGDAFQQREEALSSDPVYKRIGFNDNASFGGEPAMSWEFRDQKSGGPMEHGIDYGFPHGDSATIVEFVDSVQDEDVWTPVFDAMKKSAQVVTPSQ